MVLVCDQNASINYQNWDPTWPDTAAMVIRGIFVVLAIIFNCWILYVSYGPEKVTKSFKYPLCTLAFWDLMFSVVPFYQFFLDSVRSVVTFTTFNELACRPMLFQEYASGLGMAGALILAPTQRLFVFYPKLPFAEYVHSTKANLIFAVCMSVVGFYPHVIVFYGPMFFEPSGCIDAFCGGIAIMQEAEFFSYFWMAILQLVVALVMVFVVRKLVQMHNASSLVHTPADVKQHKEIVTACCVQAAIPILVTLPTLVYGIMFGIKSRMEGTFMQKFCVNFIHANPMMDAITTIYVIKIYRKLATDLLCRKKNEETSTVLHMKPTSTTLKTAPSGKQSTVAPSVAPQPK